MVPRLWLVASMSGNEPSDPRTLSGAGISTGFRTDSVTIGKPLNFLKHLVREQDSYLLLSNFAAQQTFAMMVNLKKFVSTWIFLQVGRPANQSHPQVYQRD